jgi:putative flippase GtrA
VNQIPENRPLLQKISRFAVIGVCATVTHLMVAAVLIQIGSMSATVINVIAFVVANLITYFGNSLWSFVSTVCWITFRRHCAASVVSLAVTSVISFVLEQQELHPWVVTLGVVLLVPPLSFLMHHFYIYRQHKKFDENVKII